MKDLNRCQKLALLGGAECLLAVLILAGLQAEQAPAQTFRTILEGSRWGKPDGGWRLDSRVTLVV